MARVSVAMAVYNGERFIREQLNSILQQLSAEDELVISYDLSNDGTWEILLTYANQYPQIRLLQNEYPGINGNFNNAISNCSGDYIFISDQDDVWADNKRDGLVERFVQSGADMIIHNGVHINAEGETISEPFFSMYRIGAGKIKNILKSRYSGCCMAFTRQMAENILPIPMDMDAYDRWIGTVGEFTGKIEYDERVLLYHRLHDQNVTPRSTRSVGKLIATRIQLVLALSRRLCSRRKK